LRGQPLQAALDAVGRDVEGQHKRNQEGQPDHERIGRSKDAGEDPADRPTNHATALALSRQQDAAAIGIVEQRQERENRQLAPDDPAPAHLWQPAEVVHQDRATDDAERDRDQDRAPAEPRSQKSRPRLEQSARR
jgi:hypothetical protein